ncbi:MAG: tetratricopeptide repeat protein [Elusimicrobia bacterium]|nr:tetratricopeptide repeat protein [Elusimicrobiota bacterium]
MRKILLSLTLACAAPAAAGVEAPRAEAQKSAQMEYMRGMLLEHRGDYAEALKAYESALAFDPDSVYICREAAGLALEVGQMDKAFRWAGRVVSLEPGSAEAHLLLGRVQWAKGDTEAAEASFEEALKLDPKSAESIYSLASLLSAKSPQKARELLERFLGANPAQAGEAHFQIAKLDMAAGRVAQAKIHLKSSIATSPDEESLPARYALAQAYEVDHDTDAALSEYLKILKFEPQDVALLDHIGQIYFMKGNWEQLRQQFENAKSVKKDDPTANHWLALYAERKGEFSKAADYLKSSAALGEEPTLSLRLSYYLTQAGRLKEAVAVLETAHARWANNDQIAYFLALGYDDLKDDAKAVKLLRKVLELKPDYRDARYQLAVLLEKGGRIEEAAKEFRALLAQKPEDASVLNYLGYSLADRGLKLAEAEDMIARAVKLDPKNPAYEDSLGWVHFKLGRSSEAMHELFSALRGLPEDETVWDHLGDVYAARQDFGSAWRFWKKSESLYSPEAKLPRKASAVEDKFSPEVLGGDYQDYLAMAEGGYQKLSGLCEIKGVILGHSLAYTGLFTFKAPEDLSIDLLGPLFTPLLRIRLNKEGFLMDPLRIEGLDPANVMSAADASVAVIRDFLSGRFFTAKPARCKKGWRTTQIEVGAWRLVLDKAGVRVHTVESASGSGVSLALEQFSRVQGRQTPKVMTVTGKGFSLSIEFTNVKMEFKPLPQLESGP